MYGGQSFGRCEWWMGDLRRSDYEHGYNFEIFDIID